MYPNAWAGNGQILNKLQLLNHILSHLLGTVTIQSQDTLCLN